MESREGPPSLSLSRYQTFMRREFLILQIVMSSDYADIRECFENVVIVNFRVLLVVDIGRRNASNFTSFSKRVLSILLECARARAREPSVQLFLRAYIYLLYICPREQLKFRDVTALSLAYSFFFADFINEESYMRGLDVRNCTLSSS